MPDHKANNTPQQPPRNSPALAGSRGYPASRTDEYLYNQLIPYIGNKRNLLGLISQALAKTGVECRTFVDFFAGSGVVSRLAKTLGCRVIANDWEPYAEAINHCYIACNTMPEFPSLGGAESAFRFLNTLNPIEGWIAAHLCPADDSNPDPSTERMFYTRANGMRIDAIREQIDWWERGDLLSEAERAVLLASLLYAACYTSNTSGVFKGFHNGWGGATGTALYRILSRLELRPPVLHDNRQANEVCRLDAQELAERLRQSRERIDVAYLDPPYNQHPYGSNYHVLNTIALWDKPEVSSSITRHTKSAIRTDWRTLRRSAYNSRRDALSAYSRLLETVDARFILTSYSTDGCIALPDMIEAATERGAVDCVVKAYKRYRVSSQRMSAKPVNAEFVLIVDTSSRSSPGDAGRVIDRILSVEQSALEQHPETAGAEPSSML